MNSKRITRLKACQSAAAAIAYGKQVSIAFVCKDDEHRKLINEYLATIWGEIPEWMKPELMIRNTRHFKFSNGAAIRLVLRPEYMKGGTYDAVFTSGDASDVAVWVCRPETTIQEMLY